MGDARRTFFCVFLEPSLPKEEGQEWLEPLAIPTHCTNTVKVPSELPALPRKLRLIHTMIKSAFVSSFHSLSYSSVGTTLEI